VDKERLDRRAAAQETVLRRWFRRLSGEPMLDADPLQEQLKDGTILCKTLNALQPGSISKYNTAPRMPMHRLENIGQFLKVCRSRYGFSEVQLFTGSDLHDGAGMKKVIGSLLSVMKKAGEDPDRLIEEVTAAADDTPAIPPGNGHGKSTRSRRSEPAGRDLEPEPEPELEPEPEPDD